MSTPIGHSLIGFALARRFGVTGRRGMAASIALANLPDIDFAAGLILHRDMWKLHRGATHTMPFALLAGALAGSLGFVSARAEGSERRVLQDALVGALLCGSHIAADRIPFVRLSRQPWVPAVLRRKFAGMSLANWLLDGIECVVIAAAVSRAAGSGDRAPEQSQALARVKVPRC